MRHTLVYCTTGTGFTGNADGVGGSQNVYTARSAVSTGHSEIWRRTGIDEGTQHTPQLQMVQAHVSGTRSCEASPASGRPSQGTTSSSVNPRYIRSEPLMYNATWC